MPRFHTNNGCISAPGLKISTTTSAVLVANTFQFKCNGRLSPTIGTFSMANLAVTTLDTATLQAPYPSGTASTAGVLKTGYYRIYSLIATLPATATNTSGKFTDTPVYSWLASADYADTTDLPSLDNAAMPDVSNSAVIGWVIVQNETGSNFTPGTTALTPTSLLTVTYVDNIYTQVNS